ncbi:MAG TPA: gluconate 2-dehydrogenase subunit 3 family protein [Gemmatimonadaceae bacterium]|nr:gluconate 2-dehydrogenase subunit 3 family protein [Gemmatimonadaceae bacterium]
MSDRRSAMGDGRDDKPISRRRVLAILGTVPVAAAVGQVPQTQTPVNPPATSHNPATTAVVGAPRAPRFFTEHEWKTLRVLVDYIIPRDERSGSATDAKVPEYIDFLLSEKDANVNEQVQMHGGLAWIDTESIKRFGKTFIQANDGQRRQILDDIAYPQKATPAMRYGVAFFNHLRDRTASGFFSSSMGWQDVKYIGNVFNPHYDGCPPAALEKLGVSYDLMQTRVSPQEK